MCGQRGSNYDSNLIRNLFTDVMKKPDQKKLAVFCQRFALVLLGLFCYLYSLFKSDFAEWRIELNGLNFPIFVGEVLLFLCLALAGYYYYVVRPQRRTPVAAAVALYAAWVLGKTWAGFAAGGPLALRTAALFYYPFFALIGYLVFDRTLCNTIWSRGVLFLMLGSMLFSAVMDYYFIAYTLLALGLLLGIKDRRWQAAGILVVGYFALHERILWGGSRSHMLGAAAAFTFVIVYFLLGFVRVSRVKKTVCLLIGIFAFAVLIFVFGDRNAVKSMSSLRRWQEDFVRLDERIKRDSGSFRGRPLEARLFNENRGSTLERALEAKASSQDLVETPKELDDLRSKAIEGLVRDYNAKSVRAAESALKQRAELVYDKAKFLLEKQNRKILEEVTSGFDWDISGTVSEVDDQVASGIKDILRDLNVKTSADLERSLEKLKMRVNELRRSSVEKIERSIDQRTREIISRLSDDALDTRSLETAYINVYFRLFIWRDMIEDLKTCRAWGGMSWGHPQRSRSLEILKWGEIEWLRDGWITPHNSFLHLIYRGGIVGVFCVAGLLYFLFNMTVRFMRVRSIWGGLLITILVYWVTISNFLVFFELPYNAIPFWGLLGMTFAYLRSLEKQTKIVKKGS